ncbi:MAG: SCO family protein [Alphaproteobacteria bacterium]
MAAPNRFVTAALAVAFMAIAPALVTPIPARALAQETSGAPYDEDAALAVSQKAVGRTVGDYAFRDVDGTTVRLADFRGKPLVVNLVYTGCSQACPLIVQTLYRAVKSGLEGLGDDSFHVVTIGFDARADTPERMRAFARKQGVALANWRFLSADTATVDALSRDVGFVFFPSPKGFDHLAQTTVVDENGVVYRQIYGADFPPPTLIEPLKDLVFGRKAGLIDITGVVNRIKLFCTLYDPASGRYRFDYSVFVGIVVGALSLLGVATVLVRGWLNSRPLR